MEEGLGVHTAARRYCMERIAFWTQQYSEIARNGRDRQSGGYHYTREALGTFPRFNVLNAILVELERIDPAELANFDTAKEFAVLAGESANDVFTVKPIGEFDRSAMAAERASYCDYIRGLAVADLSAVESLSYRRVLTAKESESIWARLRERWQIPGENWYPLVGTAIPRVAAFEAIAFRDCVPPEYQQSILKKRGVELVWELREGRGTEYIQQLALFNPLYNGLEGFWSSESLDWIIYVSHESSVTVGGWLLGEVQTIWPSWRDHQWRWVA